MTVSQNQTKQDFSSAFAFVGFFVRLFTHWITWVHEWMHGIPAAFLGGRVTRITQTKMWYVIPDMSQWHIVVLLGFWLEMGLYFTVGMIFHRRLVGKISAGIVPAVMIRGLASEDFHRVRDIYPGNEIIYLLVGVAMGVMLLYRYCADIEGASPQRVKSTVSRVKY